MNEAHDAHMRSLGYRYRLTPKSGKFEPLYAKTIAGVVDIHREYKDEQFEVDTYEYPPSPDVIKAIQQELHETGTLSEPVRFYIRPGDFVEKIMPYSEVCMHMKIAGKRMRVQLLPNGRSVQLYSSNGKPSSFPITTGEAGIFEENGNFYCYPDLG